MMSPILNCVPCYLKVVGLANHMGVYSIKILEKWDTVVMNQIIRNQLSYAEAFHVSM